jgi:hypothetical protein
MSKDFPALRMTIEGGRLVPATPFDAERINSYRRGTKVFVKFTEERDRVLVRKWFAILGLVLKQCQTPWKNKDEAHEAIKLALGIVNLSKTVSGQFMQYPKSLSELDDPELQEALEQMTELLSRMTGVDVATLRKEAADVGQAIADEEQANTDDAASASAASGEAGADEIPAASVPASPSHETPWIVTAARMLWAATHPGGGLVATEECLDVLNNQRKAVGALMPEGTDQTIKDKAGSIYTRCKQVVMQEIDQHDAKAIIAGIAGITEEDLSP